MARPVEREIMKCLHPVGCQFRRGGAIQNGRDDVWSQEPEGDDAADITVGDLLARGDVEWSEPNFADLNAVQ